ncbi:hypothetical protein [Kiloniella sp. b19]|uniref:hypothetical protein n=1 Tax=Kiloniella sp. GXU_MW_B19 TaxID=3141326 RepID=UPI0031D6CA88
MIAASSTTPEIGSKAFQTALHVVAVMGQSGMSLVPSSPTSAMLEAGSHISNLGTEDLREIYTAMIEAET